MSAADVKAKVAAARGADAVNDAAIAPAQHEWVAKLRKWSAPADLPSGEQPVEFEVEGLIPARKVGALVAAGGTGKTTLQITMYVCGATGRPFLGRSVRAGTYALLSSDDSQEDLDRALARVVDAMQLSPDELDQVKRRVRLHSLQGLGGDKTFAAMVNGSAVATGLELLVVEALRQVTDLRILGLDTLRQFSGGTTNDEQVVKLSIAGAEEIARQLGCAVVMAHHTGKSNYRDGITDMYCGSGSAAIADNCRFVMLLQSTTWSDVEAKVKRTGVEKGDPLVLQSTRGSLLVKAAPPIFLHRDGFYLGAIAGASLTLDQVLDERDRKVLAAVRSGASSKNAIFSMVKGKKTFVMAAIDDLEARGHIVNSSPTGSQTRPNFTLTASGAKILEVSE
jgi:RecA-family ATPase